MTHWRVRIDYGPEELLVEAPGEDEAREKAWNDAIEQLVINEPEEVEVAAQEAPAYVIGGGHIFEAKAEPSPDEGRE